jgi:hypothetical protein
MMAMMINKHSLKWEKRTSDNDRKKGKDLVESVLYNREGMGGEGESEHPSSTV